MSPQNLSFEALTPHTPECDCRDGSRCTMVGLRILLTLQWCESDMPSVETVLYTLNTDLFLGGRCAVGYSLVMLDSGSQHSSHQESDHKGDEPVPCSAVSDAVLT